MTNLKIFLFIFLHFIVAYAKISDFRKCANPDCSEPVSLAKTLIKYNGDDSRLLSFTSNTQVKIYSKEAGSRLDLWGAEINGKRGYVPLKLVRETKILNPNPTFLVPTEGQDDPKFKPTPTIAENSSSTPVLEVTPSPAEDSVQDQIAPNSVTPPYEIIDGTTIYLAPGDSSSPEYSSTPSSVDSSKPANLPPDGNIKTENITPDQISVTDNLRSQENSETKEEDKKVTENTIIKDEVKSVEDDNTEENLEDEDDNEGEDDEESADVEDDNEEDEEEVETSETQTNTEVPASAEVSPSAELAASGEVLATAEVPDSVEVPASAESSAGTSAKEIVEEKVVSENITSEKVIAEAVPEVDSSNSDIQKTDVSNSDSVITSPELVQDKVDHLPVDPEPAQVEPVKQKESVVDETKPEQLNETERKVKETKQNGVPSELPNPLNLFRQPEREDEQKIEPNTQVPENILPPSSENLPPSLPVAGEFIPTTQSSVDYNIPPNDLQETFTENPVEQIQIESVPQSEEILEPKVGELKEKIEETHSETNSEEIVQNSAEQIEPNSSEIFTDNNESTEIYDKPEEPTFFDTVTYNSLVSEEIPQNIENLNENIENEVPITEKLAAEETTEQIAEVKDVTETVDENEEPGIFFKIYNSIFGSGDEQVVQTEEPVSDSVEDSEKVSEKPTEKVNNVLESMWGSHQHEKPAEKYLQPDDNPEVPIQQSDMGSCASGDNSAICGIQSQNEYVQNENTLHSEVFSWSFEVPDNAYNLFLYLSLTAVTVLIFSLGFYYIEKKRKDGTLICSINTLEKKLLISTKECFLLNDELKTTKERLVSIEDSSFGSNEMVTSLKEEIEEARTARIELEEQVSNLEKELENATEAGMELNRMLREILTSQSGNEHLMQNVEQLQRQLNEQQETINTMKATLGVKNTENELLQTELTVANEKNVQLQDELNKMVVNLLSVQEEKNNIENKLEDQNEKLKSEYDTTIKQINKELTIFKDDNNKLKQKIEDTQRVLDLKNNEYDLLKQGMKELQAAQSNKDSIMALLDVSHVKAEVLQLRDEKHKMADKLQKEIDEKSVFEKEVQVMIQEVKILKDKFDEAEKEKVEAQTRLEVLSTYFKDKETQLQKEINENESKFMQKEGEATSTIERIKWIQEELLNYKGQNELLKKEILDQEVSLKSQISMLEKKSHDNWVLARQAERRLEDSKQEASQLRNRLTIVEKNLNNSTHMADESKLSNRIMSPLESNGELPVSPLLMSQVEASGSPPLLFSHRDHMTTSPPLPGLPHFMPPPPGVPFMPPPLPGVPPFMPPPPALYPGDHRPPPLGRMSSPPLRGRYSPDSRAYSPYDRDDSPPLSPSYADSDYRRRSPPPSNRPYSPYSGGKPSRHWERDDDRDYRGQQRKPRTHKGLSSGSGNSNESLNNSGRHSGRV